LRARFKPVSLDALDFLLADMRGALGPSCNVVLAAQQASSAALADGTGPQFAVNFLDMNCNRNRIAAVCPRHRYVPPTMHPRLPVGKSAGGQKPRSPPTGAFLYGASSRGQCGILRR
jgi:hypothetical protein